MEVSILGRRVSVFLPAGRAPEGLFKGANELQHIKGVAVSIDYWLVGSLFA